MAIISNAEMQKMIKSGMATDAPPTPPPSSAPMDTEEDPGQLMAGIYGGAQGLTAAINIKCTGEGTSSSDITENSLIIGLTPND